MSKNTPPSQPEEPKDPPAKLPPQKQGMFGGFADLPDAEKAPAPKDELP